MTAHNNEYNILISRVENVEFCATKNIFCDEFQTSSFNQEIRLLNAIICWFKLTNLGLRLKNISESLPQKLRIGDFDVKNKKCSDQPRKMKSFKFVGYRSLNTSRNWINPSWRMLSTVIDSLMQALGTKRLE